MLLRVQCPCHGELTDLGVFGVDPGVALQVCNRLSQGWDSGPPARSAKCVT
jgi:hypothetical protein